MNARISQDQFDRIYLEDVIPALEHDRELSFLPKDASTKYFNKGVCPGCGERTLYISKEKPFQLKCNRLNECQYEEKTRDRYRDLFENLSQRFPSSPDNPNATADAYLQRSRGFDTARIAGWYKQARRQMNDGSYAATVRFELCDGYRMYNLPGNTQGHGNAVGPQDNFVLVGLGTNDRIRNPTQPQSVNEFSANLGALLDIVQPMANVILMCSNPSSNEDPEKYAFTMQDVRGEIYRTARARNLDMIDNYAALSIPDMSLIANDGLHPNALGYYLYSRNVIGSVEAA